MKNNLIITGIISPLIALIPTLILVWRDRERKKSPLAVRILWKKAQIRKTELENQTRMEKLKLELKTLEEEAEYQNRMSKWESGEHSPSSFDKEGEVSSQTSELKQSAEQLINRLGDLKERGQEVIQKGMNEVNVKVKNTAQDLKEKGVGMIKGLTDQFKGLKDKIPGLKSED